jgi:hypothetical protein
LFKYTKKGAISAFFLLKITGKRGKNRTNGRLRIEIVGEVTKELAEQLSRVLSVLGRELLERSHIPGLLLLAVRGSAALR